MNQKGVTPLNYAIGQDNILVTQLILEYLTTYFLITIFPNNKDINSAELPLSLPT